MKSEGSVFSDLFEKGKQTELDKGDILHRSDEKCRAIGLVLSGELRLSRVLSTGKEIFMKDFRAGDIFAELIVFTAEYYPGWMIASEPSVVVEVEWAQVLQYLGGNENLIPYLAGISRKMAHLSHRIEIASFKTVREKIAFVLLNEKGGKSGIPVNITRLAEEISCSREAVSRAFNSMEAEGLLERTAGKMVVPNKKGLEDIL